jgi:hypothetical protein
MLYPLLAKAYGVDLVHLVPWIAVIRSNPIWYFRSPFIAIRRVPGLYSDRTFQVAMAIRRSYLLLLLVFMVLIRSIFLLTLLCE